MKALALASLLIVVLVALGPGLGAPAVSADGELRVSVREVSSGQTSSVQILTKVVDQNGLPIAGLTPANFSVHAGEKQIPVTRVQSATDAQVGISSLLVIDASGSMIGAPLTAARNAASQYVKSLSPVDEVSVVSFASGINVIADFTGDLAAVDTQLSRLTAFGDTALYGAVGDAAARMQARAVARRVVIFLSDGAEFGISPISRSQAIQAAANSGVPFYVIGLGPSIDATFLRELATATNGAYFAAPSSTQLAGLYAEIAELLRSEYVVTADFSNSGIGGPASVKFRAETAQGSGEVDVSVTLPAVPVAPAQGPQAGVPVPVEPVVATDGGSSAGTVLVLLLVFGGIAGLGFWFWRRRRPRVNAIEARIFDEPVLTPVRRESMDEESVRRDAPPAVLTLESGETFDLQGSATLGADATSTYRLPLSPGDFGPGHVRIWFADQRYVLRDAAPRPRLSINGRPVTWGMLGDGDLIDVKGVKLRFTLAPTPAE